MTRTALRLGCACFRCLEPKTAKNRLHLDLRVSGDGTPEHKWSRVTDEVARLSAAGAVARHTFAGHHVASPTAPPCSPHYEQPRRHRP